MKALVTIFLLLSSISSTAQLTRRYLDEKENILDGPEGATYYRETTPNGNRYEVKDFYACNEQLAMDAMCSQIVPKLVYNGPYKSYHKNGAIFEEGSYNENNKHGLWKTYYENGQPQDEVLYQPDKALYQQHWDPSGTAHLVNGTGHFTEKNKYLGEQHKEILDHQLIASYSIDPITGDSTYIVVQETATYKKGMEGLYKTIGKTLRYPAHARRMGIEGKVFIEFVVQKDGTVKDVKVLKGPHESLNQETVRVMKMMNDWTPGKVRGKAVAQKIVLPVAFKLG